MAAANLIEDFQAGYPQFSALIGADPAFHISRRFARTRMRLLLHKQDEVTLCEEKLDQIDRDESNTLFLGARRRDRNLDRSRVLTDLDRALAEYGMWTNSRLPDVLMDRNRKAFSFPTAAARDVESLQRWVDSKGCLARNETTFLEHNDDLVNLVGPPDNAVAQVEPLIEDILIYCAARFQLSLPRRFSSDKHVYFFPAAFLRTITQTVVSMIAITVLWLLTIFLNSIHTRSGLLVGIVFSAAIFTLVLSLFSRAKTIEVFVAGAGYAAVLVVFISGNSANVGS